MPRTVTPGTTGRKGHPVGRGRHSLVRWALLGLLLLVLVLLPSARPAEEPVVLGIQPFASPTSLFERYAPLRDQIGEQLGRPARIETARDFPTFLARARRERYDMILMVAPHQVPVLGNSGPYDLLARSGDRLGMAIIVPANSPIRHPHELAGQTVAAGHRDSLGVALAHRLLAPGEWPEHAPPPDYRYYPHQSAATVAMQRGLARAAVVVLDGSALATAADAPVGVRTLALADGSLTRIIGHSGTFPGATLLLHPRLATHHDALKEYLIGLARHPAGRTLLRSINHTRFEPAKLADYTPFEDFRATLPRPSTSETLDAERHSP